MPTEKKLNQVLVDRRAILMLGLTSASSLVLGKVNCLLAAQDEGIERKTLKEFETMTMIPGFKTIRVRESIFQAGASTPERKMSNAMICECTAGSFEIINDGRTFTAKKGDMWTCRKDGTEGAANKGTSEAIMHIIDLLPA
jgi:quercetin dioxygenase-like cupin family protein